MSETAPISAEHQRITVIEETVDALLRHVPEGVNRDDVGHLVSILLSALGVTQPIIGDADYARRSDSHVVLKRRAGVLNALARRLRKTAHTTRTNQPVDYVAAVHNETPVDPATFDAVVRAIRTITAYLPLNAQDTVAEDVRYLVPTLLAEFGMSTVPPHAGHEALMRQHSTLTALALSLKRLAAERLLQTPVSPETIHPAVLSTALSARRRFAEVAGDEGPAGSTFSVRLRHGDLERAFTEFTTTPGAAERTGNPNLGPNSTEVQYSLLDTLTALGVKVPVRPETQV